MIRPGFSSDFVSKLIQECHMRLILNNNEKLALCCLCPIIWSYKFRDHLHSFLILITLSLFYLSMRYWSMHDNRGYQPAYNFHQFPAKFRIIFSEIYTAVSPWNKNEWEKSIVHNSSCSFFYDKRWKNPKAHILASI